jgi:ATP-dependent Clp protease ATP-binding subunit ClpA
MTLILCLHCAIAAACMNAIVPFYPEFLNRVDDMVVFNRLKREHMAPIVDIQLKEVTIADFDV